MNKFYTFLFICLTNYSFSQEKRILFIGNSYTSVNNLPQAVKEVSESAGENVYVDSYTPGGQTLEGHFNSQQVRDKITLGNWDYVVLQEQSQRPSFPDSQVEVEVFPFAHKLDSLIKASNTCAETVFYMTWGRKNGDAGNCPFWPPVCTYEGMDSLLYLRYMQLAQNNQAIVSPVGKVWNYLRTVNPEIELYSPDESHPSIAGTYAAACSFYTTIFGGNPNLITFDFGLDGITAETIRNAASSIVYGDLSNWFIGTYSANSHYQYTNLSELEIAFINTSQNATSYFWDFGDNTTSTEENPYHIYSNSGTFLVSLTVIYCGDTSVFEQAITINNASLNELVGEEYEIYPNPFKTELILQEKELKDIKLFNNVGEFLMPVFLVNSKTINLNNLSPGIYFLELRDKMERIKRYKIVKA